MEAGRRRAINCGEARGRFQLGSGGMGEMMKLTSGAHMAVTDGEDVAAGLRKLEEEMSFGKYANAAQAGIGRARARPAGERGKGPAGWLG